MADCFSLPDSEVLLENIRWMYKDEYWVQLAVNTIEQLLEENKSYRNALQYKHTRLKNLYAENKKLKAELDARNGLQAMIIVPTENGGLTMDNIKEVANAYNAYKEIKQREVALFTEFGVWLTPKEFARIFTDVGKAIDLRTGRIILHNAIFGVRFYTEVECSKYESYINKYDMHVWIEC